MKANKLQTVQPVIIIGAARSGTKLLRDLIAEHPQIDKVPYDINYIWRIGNEQVPHDELVPDMLTASSGHQIHQQISKYQKEAPILVEKTVSNCLRVPFIDAVYPQAKYVHLIRDGRDVIESVYRQWTAPPDWRYIWRKARSFPLRSAFGYAWTYAAKTLQKAVFRSNGGTSTWGPRYRGIDADLARSSILEVCALQWARCVAVASTHLSNLPQERILDIRYETFVTQPQQYLAQLATFLSIDAQPYAEVLRQNHITRDNIGKGRRALEQEQWEKIWPLFESEMGLLGYA